MKIPNVILVIGGMLALVGFFQDMPVLGYIGGALAALSFFFDCDLKITGGIDRDE